MLFFHCLPSTSDDFFIDLVVMAYPFIFTVVCVLARHFYAQSMNLSLHWADYLMAAIIGLCVGGILKTHKVYARGEFLAHSVASLLSKIKVSPVRSYPIKLRGTIIGRGQAGNIFSEDMIFRDKTGIIFLDHQHALLNLIFALGQYDKYLNKDVIVEGWYRRAPIPFVEVKIIRTKNDSSRSYRYVYTMAAWLILLALGVGASIFLKLQFE